MSRIEQRFLFFVAVEPFEETCADRIGSDTLEDLAAAVLSSRP